jgi:hypothetical protein
MSGLFGGGRRRGPSAEEVATQEKAKEAQERAEERATAQERTEMRGAQARRRLLRRGGLRLLFSPARQEGPGFTSKLGGGS